MKVDSELWWDVNVVASVLKLFLRKLPRCLLTPGLSFIVISLLRSLFLCYRCFSSLPICCIFLLLYFRSVTV